MKSTIFSVFYFIAILVIFITCSIPLTYAEEFARPLPVFVSIMPQAYFAERIGGNLISVNVLVPPGKNPENYAPKPSQIKKLKKATLFFRIGVPFENGLIPKIKSSTNQLEIIDTRAGIQLREMDAGHHHNHSGDDHDHLTENGKDPHIWMNPLFAIRQAETMCQTLIRIDPDNKSEFEANLKSFSDDMISLDKKIRDKLAPFKGKSIFVFHPAFGYFTDAYGMKQIAVETEGKSPKGKRLSFFIEKARQENRRVIFVQPQFDTNAAAKIAKAINGSIVFFNPLAKDYINNLETITEKIAEAMQ
jgi:zinc transport system substrate-binding protein